MAASRMRISALRNWPRNVRQAERRPAADSSLGPSAARRDAASVPVSPSAPEPSVRTTSAAATACQVCGAESIDSHFSTILVMSFIDK